MFSLKRIDWMLLASLIGKRVFPTRRFFELLTLSITLLEIRHRVRHSLPPIFWTLESFNRPFAMTPSSKRRKTTRTVNEITFDPTAREEYLTGFHKRKQARIKHAQDEAAKKEKEEK